MLADNISISEKVREKKEVVRSEQPLPFAAATRNVEKNAKRFFPPFSFCELSFCALRLIHRQHHAISFVARHFFLLLFIFRFLVSQFEIRKDSNANFDWWISGEAEWVIDICDFVLCLFWTWWSNAPVGKKKSALISHSIISSSEGLAARAPQLSRGRAASSLHAPAVAPRNRRNRYDRMTKRLQSQSQYQRQRLECNSALWFLNDDEIQKWKKNGWKFPNIDTMAASRGRERKTKRENETKKNRRRYRTIEKCSWLSPFFFFVRPFPTPLHFGWNFTTDQFTLARVFAALLSSFERKFKWETKIRITENNYEKKDICIT